MGKAVPRIIKNRAKELLELYPEKFSTDFEKNKASLKELGVQLTKLEINLTASYIARLIKVAQPKE
ncbi:MAG: 30S ribosomal protein S17e [Candidatus Diapherotrites archaeon]